MRTDNDAFAAAVAAAAAELITVGTQKVRLLPLRFSGMH